MCLSSIFELRITLKGWGQKYQLVSYLQSKTAAADIARVWGKEQGTKYLERMGEMQRAYLERAECKKLLILHQPVTKQEDIRCILETIQNIRRSQERTKHKNQVSVRGLLIPLLALLASMTSAYSSLGVSRELNPRPQLLPLGVPCAKKEEEQINVV